jgi:hypothetical protein
VSAHLGARSGAARGEKTHERKRRNPEDEPKAHPSNELSPRSPIRHNFVTLLSVVASEPITTLSPRTMSQLFSLNRKRAHSHRAVRTYVLEQRLGIPYEVERTVCAECRQVLQERPLKRAAA